MINQKYRDPPARLESQCCQNSNRGEIPIKNEWRKILKEDKRELGLESELADIN